MVVVKLLISLLSRLLGSAAIAAGAFFFAFLAMRPFGVSSSLSSPELWLAMAVAVLAFAVCLRRLCQGESFREQVRALYEAAFGGDHLG
jgi:hypothetical protein